MPRGKLYDFYAEITVGAARSMVTDLGLNPNGFHFDQTGGGVTAQERSENGPPPWWMTKLKAQLDEQGITCTIG